MRLDKYIKISRIIKRRTLAKELADNQRIQVNDKVAKAGHQVKVGDILKISFGNKLVTIQIEKIQESTKKDDSSDMYVVLKEEKL